MVIELSNSRTEPKLPSRKNTVMSLKNRSTLFIQELEVGVKCTWKRGCFASHAFTFACLCVA
ncbi:hypothetical protein D3C84_1212770 [compost metagenome]